MIPTSHWRDSWGNFVRPNTGSFDILDISCLQEPASQRIVHLYHVDVRCLCCNHVFCARDGSGMATVPGAKVLTCPECTASQAVSNAELVRCIGSCVSAPIPRTVPTERPAVAA